MDGFDEASVDVMQSLYTALEALRKQENITVKTIISSRYRSRNFREEMTNSEAKRMTLQPLETDHVSVYVKTYKALLPSVFHKDFEKLIEKLSLSGVEGVDPLLIQMIATIVQASRQIRSKLNKDHLTRSEIYDAYIDALRDREMTKPLKNSERVSVNNRFLQGYYDAILDDCLSFIVTL